MSASFVTLDKCSQGDLLAVIGAAVGTREVGLSVCSRWGDVWRFHEITGRHIVRARRGAPIIVIDNAPKVTYNDGEDVFEAGEKVMVGFVAGIAEGAYVVVRETHVGSF